MVYVIEENLEINGQPGGYVIDSGGRLAARPNARLAIDPGVLVKIGGARIETQIGSQFIAEGTAAKPIIFTSVFDDRFGAGGSFDTTNDGSGSTPSEGDWGGLYLRSAVDRQPRPYLDYVCRRHDHGARAASASSTPSKSNKPRCGSPTARSSTMLRAATPPTGPAAPRRRRP